MTMKGTPYHPSQASRSATACTPAICGASKSGCPHQRTAGGRWLLNGYCGASPCSRQETCRPICRDMVNYERFRNVSRSAQLARRGHRGERFCDKARDVAETNSLIEERRNGDFIGGVEGGGRASAGAQRIDRQPERRKTLEVGAFKGQSAKRGKVRRSHPGSDPIWVGQTMRNRGPHVRRRHARDQGPVSEGDEPVHDRLRVHHDIKPVGWQTE